MGVDWEGGGQQGQTLVRVMRSPRMEEMTMMPTAMKEMCWDQNWTWDHNYLYPFYHNETALYVEL